MRLTKYLALLIGLSLLISACSNNQSSPPPPPPDANADVVRVEIEPGGVITLTEATPTIILDAVVYGENDVVLNRSVTWSIEDETIADITISGQVTALAFGKPTSVTATAGGVSSAATAINTATLQDGVTLQSVNIDDILRNELVSDGVVVEDLLALIEDGDPIQFELTFASSLVADYAVSDTLLVQGDEGFVGEILEKREQGDETTLLVEQSYILDVFRSGEFRGTVETGELTPTVEPLSVQTVGAETIYTFDAQSLTDQLKCRAGAQPVQFTGSGITISVTSMNPIQADLPVIDLRPTFAFPFARLERFKFYVFGEVITNIDFGNLTVEVSPNVDFECELTIFEVPITQVGLPMLATLQLDSQQSSAIKFSASAGSLGMTMELPKANIDLAYGAGVECAPNCRSLNNQRNNSSTEPSSIQFSFSTGIEVALEYRPVNLDIGLSLKLLNKTIDRQSLIDIQTFIRGVHEYDKPTANLTFPFGEERELELDYTARGVTIDFGVRSTSGIMATILEGEIYKRLPFQNPLKLFGADVTLFEFNTVLLQLSDNSFRLDEFPEAIVPGQSYDVVVRRNKPNGILVTTISEGMGLVLINEESGEERLFFIENPATELTSDGFAHRGNWTAPNTLESGQWRAYAWVIVLINRRMPIPFLTRSISSSVVETPLEAANSVRFIAAADYAPSLRSFEDLTAGTSQVVTLERFGTTVQPLTVTLQVVSPPSTIAARDIQIDGETLVDTFEVTFPERRSRTTFNILVAEDALNQSPERLVLGVVEAPEYGLSEPNELIFDVQAPFIGNRVCEGDFRIDGDRNDTEQVIAELSSCRVITGSLTVSGTSLTDFSFLANLTSVEGDIRVGGVAFFSDIKGNPELISFGGLEGLTSVGGSLIIGSNNSLTSLRGLEGLTRIGGTLSIGGDPFEIGGNTALTSLQGLEGVTHVGNTIDISDNTALTSLRGLEGITNVRGDLIIRGNDALTSLRGLEGITSVSVNANIQGNDTLTSLSGLEGITSVGGALAIVNNTSLTSLRALERLTSVARLTIGSNDALTSLAGLESITRVEFGDIEIAGNAKLTSLRGLAGITGEMGILGIFGNDALTSLSGLEGISSLEGYLQIVDNDSLVSLNGLEGLSEVGEVTFLSPDFPSFSIGLNINGNDALTSLEGTENITEVEGPSEIDDNRSLNCTPFSNFPYMPVDESTGNLVNCPASPLVEGTPITGPVQPVNPRPDDEGPGSR